MIRDDVRRGPPAPDRAGSLPGGCGRRHPRPVRGVRRCRPAGRDRGHRPLRAGPVEEGHRGPHGTVHARHGRPGAGDDPGRDDLRRHRRLRAPRDRPVQRGVALSRRPPPHPGPRDAGARRGHRLHGAGQRPLRGRPDLARPGGRGDCGRGHVGQAHEGGDGGRLPADRAAGGLPPVPRLHRHRQGERTEALGGFRIGGRKDGEVDRYVVHVGDGVCTIETSPPEGQARDATITVEGSTSCALRSASCTRSAGCSPVRSR